MQLAGGKGAKVWRRDIETEGSEEGGEELAENITSEAMYV